MSRWQQTRWCSCGVVTHGNGGWTSHRAAHRRRDEWNNKYKALTRDQYLAAFPDRHVSGALKRDLWTTTTNEQLQTEPQPQDSKMKQRDKESLITSLQIRLAEINLYALRESAGQARGNDNEDAQRAARDVSSLICKIVDDD